MVTEQPERREGVGRVRLSPDAPELLPDLSLLPLEVVHHLLHEQRVDPGGDGPKLCRLFFLHTSKERLQVRASLKDLLAVPPQQPVLMPLQRTSRAGSRSSRSRTPATWAWIWSSWSLNLHTGHSQYQTAGVRVRRRCTVPIRLPQGQRTSPRSGRAACPGTPPPNPWPASAASPRRPARPQG
jgi:hypothetical protein